MKWKGLQLLVVCFLFVSKSSFAQQPDTLIKKLDSLSTKTDSAGGQVNNINQKAYNDRTKITFGTYFVLLGSDFKQQFTKPFHMTSRDWGKFGIFAATTGALMLADEPVQQWGHHVSSSSKTVADVSHYVTNTGGLYEIYTLAALGAYGLI